MTTALPSYTTPRDVTIGLICGPLVDVAAPAQAPTQEPAPPAPEPFVVDLGSFDGVWDTVSSAAGNFTLILKVEGKNITGHFGHSNASLDGTLQGRIAKNGSSFGYSYSQPGIDRSGTGTFALSADGTGISGDFFSEQDAQDFHWEGRRRD